MWRVEDLDPPRVQPGAAAAAAEDLAWLGIDWDEDPDAGGPYAPYVQSERSSVYEAALRLLDDAGRLFPCRISRRELASISSAPHPGEEEAPFPASARPASVPDGWYDELSREGAPAVAIRFRVNAEAVHFVDRIRGEIEERVDRSCGDFVLKRRDGLYAYQLAVVVDDWAMRIDEVVRGADLIGSTARQIQLLEALGARRPTYAHVPMVLAPSGEKLSKRDQALTLRSLRSEGIRPEQVVGYLAWSLGILDTAKTVSARDLIGEFAWNRIHPEDFVLPTSAVERMRALR